LDAIDVDRIRQFIVDVKPETQDFNIEPTSDLFDLGALDSYSVIMLIQLLEERLDIVFDYSDLRAFHFENLESILKLLKNKYEVV
jgi:acyl carrier protein